MSTNSRDTREYSSDVFNRAVRAVILVIVALIISVAAVSFAVHHMRLQFEDEFESVSDTKIHQIADLVSKGVNGDDITNDPSAAAVKYSHVLSLMLADTSSENLSVESYGLFSYKDGHIEPLFVQGTENAMEFAVANREISEWLNSDNSQSVIHGDNFESIIVPITNSSGVVVAVFEYKCVFNGLVLVGDGLEGRILVAVLISFAVAVVLFVLQEILIRLMRRSSSSAHAGESAKGRMKRIISSTIGYCFTTILVVLFVMSSQLTRTYILALESERSDSMQAIALSSASLLGHNEIAENMEYKLPIYSYAEGKDYIVNIYVMAGDSFQRLYSSASDAVAGEQYYLANAGEQYIKCFQNQEVAFTSRSDKNESYVCAIAPIISQDNTVAGVYELCMPRDDFESTVNGMSLSWIFTIVSIALSMGIIIFEINLLISTIAKGISGNGPVLIMYGENANRLLSFFAAFSAVMIPITFAGFYKEHFEGESVYLIQGLIAGTTVLFAGGFFGFSSLRSFLKSKLTGRIALITMTSLGYFLALICGITDNEIVLTCLALPMGFCLGMPLDYLRTYRINAGKSGYRDFDDRTVHNVQASSYMLGVSVGVVIAGICYERFGLFAVSLIGGAASVLTAVGMNYFMKNNSNVNESQFPISRWMSMFRDKYAGKFLCSSFMVLGMIVSFLLVFVPNFLGRVGISLATASFYYLIVAVMASFVAAFIKSTFAHLLTSRTRVVVQGLCTVIGLLLFALMPSAKMLVATCIFLGIALGIHDFYYIYVLFLICNNRIKTNLRRCAEVTFYVGLGIMIPVFMAAFMLGQIRIVLLLALLVVAILSFVYPMSPFSSKVDGADPSLKPERKKAPRPQNDRPYDNRPQSAPQAPVQAPTPAPAPAPQAPAAPQMPYEPAMPYVPSENLNPGYNEPQAYQAPDSSYTVSPSASADSDVYMPQEDIAVNTESVPYAEFDPARPLFGDGNGNYFYAVEGPTGVYYQPVIVPEGYIGVEGSNAPDNNPYGNSGV
ncbi:MAG: hypothetical protein J5778_05960 [Clostridiales bacterium]|nr:hypothetical protein [Clostridiales bacterium]